MTSTAQSTNISKAPYLRTSRQFPEKIELLSIELNKSYVDTAHAVNNRIIGIHTLDKPSVGGENWFLNTTVNQFVQKSQNLRQVYSFTSTGNIPHNVLSGIFTISPKSYGVFNDGTNWYGVIFGSSVAIAGQVSFYVTPSVGTTSGNIVVLSGAGAPTITNGFILLEWLSQV